ncbi:hypothetical protein MAHJHV63_54960 [Mycobacterium avium subsp. hominissuis]
MRIAMISEHASPLAHLGDVDVLSARVHASPLAHLGGVDAGGQNVHVAELSCALARRV